MRDITLLALPAWVGYSQKSGVKLPEHFLSRAETDIHMFNFCYLNASGETHVMLKASMARNESFLPLSLIKK
jgi:hypothetical protein